jgi:hypothetical protein|nr:MmpS family transport accessory protein [uncultured Pedobacter sp.]
MKKLTIAIIAVFTILVSCSKNDDNPTPADSRNIKYEITGNATGTFDVTYTTGSGSGTNEAPTSLPWSKEIVLQNDVNSVVINSAVIGATPGKIITTKIYVGGVERKSETATVQSNGTAIIAGLSYTIK